jgi:hypothetical protein
MSRTDPYQQRGRIAVPKNPLSTKAESERSRKRRDVDRAAANTYHREYNEARKASHPEYLELRRASARRSAKNRRERIKRFVRKTKSRPSWECGVRLPPEVMDLDHLYGPKKFDIAHCTRKTYRSYVEIEQEVRKCRVVCPNCHRMRHHGERTAECAGGYFWTDGLVSEIGFPLAELPLPSAAFKIAAVIRG